MQLISFDNFRTMICNYFLIFITCVHSFSNHALTFGNQNINKLYACIFSRMLKCLKNASKCVHTSSSLQIEFDDITIFKMKIKTNFYAFVFWKSISLCLNKTLMILKTVKWHLHARDYIKLGKVSLQVIMYYHFFNALVIEGLQLI